MDGAKGAVAHGCALARPPTEVILKIAKRPAGLSEQRTALLVTFAAVGKSDS